jgi:hypothetical protein
MAKFNFDKWNKSEYKFGLGFNPECTHGKQPESNADFGLNLGSIEELGSLEETADSVSEEMTAKARQHPAYKEAMDKIKGCSGEKSISILSYDELGKGMDSRAQEVKDNLRPLHANGVEHLGAEIEMEIREKYWAERQALIDCGFDPDSDKPYGEEETFSLKLGAGYEETDAKVNPGLSYKGKITVAALLAGLTLATGGSQDPEPKDEDENPDYGLDLKFNIDF